ncbi:TetR/AcrR family transcriptional regulator [Bradyrhizobium sp. SZCCHNS3004]|uniref:TetR/AcrR family transcriptional regulator n=1 Tax=Bradyrhizobium sp. SZCCHNS3004 TaxID=3057312 RepID=UPI002916B8B5|nr:TetR/AcrR family transcriptional regulator [Bradyrhizobium sp. SZCCHNS3004]
MPTSKLQAAASQRVADEPDTVETTRADRKHRQILDSARTLFLAHGFDPTSVDAIARHARVSKATLYSHFQDKETLLLALVEDECRNVGGPLWKPHDGPIELEKELRAIARSFLSFFMDGRGLAMHRLIMSCASRYPEIADVFMKVGPDRCDAEVAAFLRAAQAQGLLHIPDIALAAMQFLSLIQGRLILKWSLSMQSPSPAEYRMLVDGGIKVFLAAYRAADRKPHACTTRTRRQ